MENLAGKKLLVLGASENEKEIIRCARKLGIYVIATDSNKDWALAPAKVLADEGWDISWSDMAALKRRCESSGVDGVIAGFSEKRVACANELAERLRKPFYASGSHLDTIQNKRRFKDACRDVGIETPRSYENGESFDLPVIVKPSDNAGSRGITICHGESMLPDAYEAAMRSSASGQIEIEDYIVADEVMVYYVVHRREATLSAMCDRYMHSFSAEITQLPVGYRFPSRHLALFKDEYDAKFKNLIAHMGIQDGLIAFQCFVRNGGIIPFDPTYRLDGTMAYHFTDEVNGSNVLSMLIRHSLTGTMGDDSAIRESECPDFDCLCFELPILLGRGTIARVSGLEEACFPDGVLSVVQNFQIGAEMQRRADFSQIFCRIHLVAHDNDDLEKKLDRVFRRLEVVDEEGGDMVLYRDAHALAYGEVER